MCNVDLSVWAIENVAITGNIWTVNGKFGTTHAQDQRWEQATNKQLKVQIRYKRVAPDNKSEFKDASAASLARSTKSSATAR